LIFFTVEPLSLRGTGHRGGECCDPYARCYGAGGDPDAAAAKFLGRVHLVEITFNPLAGLDPAIHVFMQ
jgi:hypothetical protein